MSDPNTIRVLEIDGGGMRGYLPANFFKLFVNQWGVDPTTIWKQFDVICGSSIGGIMALALGSGLTPDQLLPFFTVDGPWIFTIRTAADVASGSINASLPSNTPNTIQKIGILFNNDQFYASVSPDSNYGSSRLQSSLVNTFGTQTMNNLKTKVLITSLEQDTETFRLFSNANYAEYIGQNELITNVARATSAAPLYLPPMVFNGHTYIDGGVYQNNPAQLGVALAQSLRPTAKRCCLLSLGTGLGTLGFDEAALIIKKFAKHIQNKSLNEVYNQIEKDLNAINLKQETIKNVKDLAALIKASTPFEDAVKSLVQLLDTAMTGAQESVAQAFNIQSKYTLNQFYYYRFQPTLDPDLDTELDNSTPEILTYYENLATEVFNSDADAISNFIGHLTA
jgi:patatin-like phospholipase/acyl hydrolase